MKAAHKPGSLGCLIVSQSVPKLLTHNLVRGPMCVSNWPKRPNMAPKPCLGDDNISPHALDPENFKNIIFSLWGHGNIQNDVMQPVRASEHLNDFFSHNDQNALR